MPPCCYARARRAHAGHARCACTAARHAIILYAMLLFNFTLRHALWRLDIAADASRHDATIAATLIAAFADYADYADC